MLGKLLARVEGWKTYIGAGILAAAAFAGAVGWLTADQAKYLSEAGAAVIAVGLRAAFGKLLKVAEQELK